jgi:endonuclease YncB( thermonuclease family)
MVSPYYQVIKGNFIIIDKKPDGDSIRFLAEEPDLYSNLSRSYRLNPSKDGTVQIRLEGIDTPELHYGKDAQPFGEDSRDRLLKLLGFRDFAVSGNTITSAKPEIITGAILTTGVETNGRPISYIVSAEEAKTLENGEWVKVTKVFLQKTLNYQMIQEGMAYYTVYTSTPLSHREFLQKAAKEAQQENRGLWKIDRTREFVLNSQEDLSPPDGQLILPKLFRRCTDYLKAVSGGFRGNLKDWLLANNIGSSRPENDRVLLGDVELKLSDLISQNNNRIFFQANIFDLTFLEK